MEDDTQLPGPHADIPSDIQFRRLLYASERRVSELASTSNGPVTHSDTNHGNEHQFDVLAAKLKNYVDTLEEQLAELERFHSRELGPETLAAYKQRVRQLSGRLPTLRLPPYCVKAAPRAQLPDVLLGASSSSASGAGAAAPSFLGTFGDNVKSRLQQHEALQEHLTSELADMAAALKKSTLEVQDAVRRRGEVVDETERHLDASLLNAKQVAARSKEQYSRSSGTFCLTCLVLLAVALVFTLMIVYIKFTYLLGYRAQQAAAASHAGGMPHLDAPHQTHHSEL